MCLRNLWDFHAKIVHIILEKFLEDLQDDIVFNFCSIIFFLKIGLTVAVLACFKYLFQNLSLLIILATRGIGEGLPIRCRENALNQSVQWLQTKNEKE